MDCPVCESKELRRDRYEGVSIFRCDNCHGVLAEERRLRQIRVAQQRSTASLEHEAESEASLDTEDKLHCPRCRARRMVKEEVNVESRHDASFTIDICHDCDSVWFDGGELARLQLDFEQSAQAVEAWRLKKLSEQRTPEEEKELEERIAKAPPPSNTSFLLPTRTIIIGVLVAVLVFCLLLFLWNLVVN